MTEAAGTTVTPQTAAPDAAAPASQATGSFSVPEQYASLRWAQSIKSSDDLWAQMANAQSLIGKRPGGIPAQDAGDEEWAKFYQAWGRPEAADKYALESNFEGLPEGLDTAQYEQMAKQIAFDLGLNSKQAQQLWASYMKYELEGYNKNLAKHKDQTASLDKQFDEIAAKIWGDKFDEVSRRSVDFISSSVPDDLKPYVSGIIENPQALAVMVALSDHAQKEISAIKQKYGAEDGLKSGAQTHGMSQQEVIKKLTEANLKAKSADPFSQDRKAAEDEAQTLRALLAKMVNK